MNPLLLGLLIGLLGFALGVFFMCVFVDGKNRERAATSPSNEGIEQ